MSSFTVLLDMGVRPMLLLLLSFEVIEVWMAQ